MSRRVNASLLLLGWLLFMVGCSQTSDEEQIQTIIENMTASMEAGKPAELSTYLHDDFRANQQMDAKQVKQMLMMYGMQHRSISLTVVSSRTTIDPVYTDKAVSVLSVVTTGTTHGNLPDDGGIHVVHLKWRKDSEWKLLAADWE